MAEFVSTNTPTIYYVDLPNGNRYYFMDQDARDAIEKLQDVQSTGVHYEGKVTTKLADGDKTTALTKADGSTFTATKGSIVNVDGVSYAFDGETWDQWGLAGALHALAYKDEVTAEYTPAGTISAPGFTGSNTDVSVSGTPSGTVSKPGFTGSNTDVSVSGTPAGDVSVALAAPADGETADYTPTGKVTVTPNTKSINQVKGVGSLPAWSASVSDGGLKFSWDAGTLPTEEAVTVADGIKAASFTGDGVKTTGSFTGKAMTSKGTVVPKGSVSQPIFTGDEMTSTGSVTPKGTVTAPTFTGSKVSIVSK